VSEETELSAASAAEPINEPARDEASSAMETVATASLPLETPPAPMPPPAAAAPPPRRMTAREVSQLADELGAEVADNAVPSPPRSAPSNPPPTANSDEVAIGGGACAGCRASRRPARCA
jgi:hypothetical protein